MNLNIRELQKATLQHIILPLAYRIFSYQPIDDRLVVFADSRDEEINYNSYSMYQEVQKRGYKIELYMYNFDKLSNLQKLWKSLMFMKLYARAKYVFIYNYYLPVSSCNKRTETKVVQLWHASGALKKFGFDSPDDLGSAKGLNPSKNFDIVAVSSENIRKCYSSAFNLPLKNVFAFGTSRTDLLFNKDYMKACKEKFYNLYPDAKGKKVVLWAPSFRGNDVNGETKFLEEFSKLQIFLGDQFYVVIKLHPHLKDKYHFDNCVLDTNEIYSAVDVLITDYSSILFDFALLNKPIILYVPDVDEYTNKRGMYREVNEIPYKAVFNINELLNVLSKLTVEDKETIEMFKNEEINMNDGLSSKRILDFLEANRD